jgi:hypothetical protein
MSSRQGLEGGRGGTVTAFIRKQRGSPQNKETRITDNPDMRITECLPITNRLIDEEYCILGCTPCGLVEVYQRFGGMYCLHLQDRRLSQKNTSRITLIAFCSSPCPAYSWTLWTEAVGSSETSGLRGVSLHSNGRQDLDPT